MNDIDHNNLITIREARPDDAKAIAAIYNVYVCGTTISFETEPVSDEEMRRRITELTGQYPYFVAETADGNIAGYCYAHEWKTRPAYRHTWETTVYVDERQKHGHIGKLLMEKLIETCKGRQCHALIACITSENEASRRFHERLGFTLVSEFKGVGFKFGRWLGVADYELIL